jgi:hypothetical protein
MHAACTLHHSSIFMYSVSVPQYHTTANAPYHSQLAANFKCFNHPTFLLEGLSLQLDARTSEGMRQPTIHQMREKKKSSRKSRRSRKVTICFDNHLQGDGIKSCTTSFRVKKCYFHYDFACKKVPLSLRYATKLFFLTGVGRYG